MTAAALVAAFALTMPRRGARGGNYGRSAFEKAVFVLGSPLLAMPLSLGITDPPVTALVCLALVSSERASAKGASGDPAAAAVSRRGSDLWAVWTGLAVGTACAMKATAWPCLVVIAALFVARDGARRATRFLVTSAVSAVALVLITAPKLVADPRALYENTVAFPLGLAGRHTPAASPLPGHVLAGAGHVGHLVAVGLVVVAGLGVAVSLVLRPPRDVGAATLRLVVALVLLFTLAPEARFGYFAYPAVLLVWLALSRRLALPVLSTAREHRTGQLLSRLSGRAGSWARRGTLTDTEEGERPCG